MAATPTIEHLLAHEGWIRAIARGLLFDETQVDDVVQEAWLTALDRPPRDAGALRSWLATVARNLARRAGRTAGRVARREHAAAASEALPPVAQLVERAELRRHVVEAVLALEEPYRRTVMWRYFEDLSAAEIAARSGEPAGTVRSRLKRGLDQLRERLDGRHGGQRRAWALALVPVAALGAPPAEAAGVSSSVGDATTVAARRSPMLVKSVIVAAVAVVGFVGGSAALFRGGAPTAELPAPPSGTKATPGAPGAPAGELPVAPADPPELPPLPDGERAAAPPAAPPDAPAAADDGAPTAVSGRVHAAAGTGLLGVTVLARRRDDTLECQTDVDGRYRLDLGAPDAAAVVWVDVERSRGWLSLAGLRRTAARTVVAGATGVDFELELVPDDAAAQEARRRIAANEAAAIRRLRALIDAQATFQMQACVDQDGDGIGEFGTLGELSGVDPIRGSRRTLRDAPLVAAILGVKDANGIAQSGGYCFRLYLPTGHGATVVEPRSAADADAQAQEVRWACYAWPTTRGVSGNRAFFTNHAGDVYMTPNGEQRYSGWERMPTPEAALDQARLDAAGAPARNLNAGVALAAAGLTACDGGVWAPCGN